MCIIGDFKNGGGIDLTAFNDNLSSIFPHDQGAVWTLYEYVFTCLSITFHFLHYPTCLYPTLSYLIPLEVFLPLFSK